MCLSYLFSWVVFSIVAGKEFSKFAKLYFCPKYVWVTASIDCKLAQYTNLYIDAVNNLWLFAFPFEVKTLKNHLTKKIAYSTFLKNISHFPAGNYMFKVNNRNTRTRCENRFKINSGIFIWMLILTTIVPKLETKCILFNSLNAKATITWKLVNWFPLQISWLVSIWCQLWRLIMVALLRKQSSINSKHLIFND